MASPATAARRPKREEAPPPPSLWTHGTFHWNELLARDVERAKRFYRSTIGWSFQSMQMPDGGTYWLAMLGERPVAGIYSIGSPEFDGMPECWMSYLAVDDVDKRVAKAIKAGAKLMKPLFDVPDVGRIAILTEPGGAGVGWMTPFCNEVAKRKTP
jgi:predicted enzyme related to lactoylglutathione lyase